MNWVQACAILFRYEQIISAERTRVHSNPNH